MENLIYSKKALTVPEQIEFLQTNGVVIEDISFAKSVLKNVSFYRFRQYLFPFRIKDGSNTYTLGTSFLQAWQYYCFDRRLRLCVMDAIERVEVAVKTQIVNHLALKYGVFAYCNRSVFASSLDENKYEELLSVIKLSVVKSKEEFVQDFYQKYGKLANLPIWMVFEIISFGNMLTLFRLLKKQDKEIIAKAFYSNAVVFESWLAHLNYIRNICAHHARLWNRQMAVNPLIPKKDLKWHEMNFPVNERRIYSTLCILKTLIDIITPQSNWKDSFYLLLQEFPMIYRIAMAIPEDFENSSIWKE